PWTRSGPTWRARSGSAGRPGSRRWPEPEALEPPARLPDPRAAPQRHRVLRSRERAPVRAVAGLLSDRLGVRASLVRLGAGLGRQRHPAIHPGLLPPRVRPVHRDHHAEPEAGDQEEPEGPPPPGAVPGDPV